MVLRTAFDGLPNSRQAHRDDHLVLHRCYNAGVFADDYDSLQAAVDAAFAAGISRVMLDPTTVYTLSSTLDVPAEVWLDGGGRSATGFGVAASRIRATIITSQPLDPMIRIGHFGGVIGCHINGNDIAKGAIFLQDVIYPWITDCLIAECLDYGIKAGGALYVTIKRNYTYNISNGWGLDAQRAYGNTGYYGINVGISEMNEWGGVAGAMRFEGILTSISDDFENGSFDGPGGVIEIGAGGVNSHLIMYSPYFELGEGTSHVVAVKVNVDGSLRMYNAKAFGDNADPDDTFIECDDAVTLVVMGCAITRFGTVFKGTFRDEGTVAVVASKYSNYAVVCDFSTDLRNVSSCLVASAAGWTTENKGVGMIANGETSTTITHGLYTMPAVQEITVMPSGQPTNSPGLIWVDNVGSDTFQVNCENDPGLGGLGFGWHAKIL